MLTPLIKMSDNEVLGELFTAPREWQYRGEGNCNLVISLPKSKQILRIRKTEKPKSLIGWILVLITDLFHWYYGKGFKEEIRDLNFYNTIMRPLVGHEYTSESKQVILSRKQLQIFKDGLSRKRPDFRQNKTLQFGRAALFSDYAFLPDKFDHLQFEEHTFAIEIKPKQGWRPLKEQIYPQCLFCMNQHLKLEKKRVHQRSLFCPEELFSGNEIKMRSALRNLMEVPQNNFSIFKNGSLHYSDKDKGIEVLNEIFEDGVDEETLKEELCNFIYKCLVKQMGNDNFNCNCCKNLEKLPLPKGSVLERILSMQMLDRDGTHSSYKKLTKLEEWDEFSFADKLLEIVQSESNSGHCIKCIVAKAEKYENELLFVPYLISAIARDCSLMITFRKLKDCLSHESSLNNVVKTKFGSFVVNIGVFDLYPKPLSTIKKHFKRNKEIFKVLKKRGLIN